MQSIATLELEIQVNKAKCFDDLIELNEHISELCDLIPDHMHYKAKPHADRISDILQSFVRTQPDLDDLL